MVHLSFGAHGVLELFRGGHLEMEQVIDLPEVRAFAADHPEALTAKCDLYRYYLRGEGEERDATADEIEKIVDDAFPDHPMDLIEVFYDGGESSLHFTLVIPKGLSAPDDTAYTVYH